MSHYWFGFYYTSALDTLVLCIAFMTTKHHCYWSDQGLRWWRHRLLHRTSVHRWPTWLHVAAQCSGNIVLLLDINNPGHGLCCGPLPNECDHPPAGKAFPEARGSTAIGRLPPDAVTQLTAEDLAQRISDGKTTRWWWTKSAGTFLGKYLLRLSPIPILHGSLDNWHFLFRDVDTRELGTICPKP